MGMALGNDESLDFKVGADQVDRLYLGKAYIWPNVPITDFVASDDLVRELTFTWTDPNEVLPHSYDLYENEVRMYDNIVSGQTLEATDGTATYHIRALYEGGHHIKSNTDEGTALDGTPPTEITDFSATDDQIFNVQCFWSDADGDPAPTYEVYRDGGIIAQFVESGYNDNRAPGTSDYFVKAVNFKGEVDSNHDSGTAKDEEPPPPVCTPGSTYFNVPGVYGAIVPAGVTNIDICMVAGGGSGAAGNVGVKGGGYAGQEWSGNVGVTPGGSITITVGAGGAPKGGGTGGNGNSGGNSGVGSTVTTGGGGGALGGGYTGSGGAGPGGCGGGGRSDGADNGDTPNHIAYGGQATSFGHGGKGAFLGGGNGGTGAGGGGCAQDSGQSQYSGAGGAGYVGVSWDCALVATDPVYKLSEMTEAEMKRRQIQPLQNDGITLMTYEEWSDKLKEL